MATGVRGKRGVRTIRTRILLIAWVPSLALLLVGVAIAGYLGVQAAQVASDSKTISNGTSGARDFVVAIQDELPVTAATIVDPDRPRAALDTQRTHTDQAMASFAKIAGNVQDAAPAEFRATNVLLTAAIRQLSDVRSRVDTGKISLLEASRYYSRIVQLVGTAAGDLGRSAPDGQIALEEAAVTGLFEVNAEMVKGNALAYAAFSDVGMDEFQYREFARSAGDYRDRLQNAARGLSPDLRAKVAELTDSPAWRQQASVEEAVMNSVPAVATGPEAKTGPAPLRQAELPITRLKWEAAAEKVSSGLTGLALAQTSYSSGLVTDAGTSQLGQALIAGGLLIAFAVGILVLTARTSNQLIGRLRRLRRETLDLAQSKLPIMVERLRAGEKVDAIEELPNLDLGADEIGQVADAFNYAQRVAVAAAVQEAETRAGLRAVFLNIAYRSQVIVHRQLGVLERAERFQEDPDQLKLLFELDHLATRSRRNAENLVILGGGQPGRRWRNPVTLIQVVRGAISEAQDYTRVSTTPLPGLSIRGAAVADVIHLLAELVDNATAFSPPMSRVEVRGNLVGRGLVLEIEDQGLGIPADQLVEFNEMLQNPPDFHVMALSDEPRLGMFVIAKLARGQGIRVTLTPSPAYGGTKAVVLIPSELIDISTMVEQPLMPSSPPIAATRRLSPVIDRPALAFSQSGSEGSESGSIRPRISLHERMAIEGEGAPPQETTNAWPAPAEDLIAPQVPAVPWTPTPTDGSGLQVPGSGRSAPNGTTPGGPLPSRPLPTGTPASGTPVTGRVGDDSSPTTLPPGLSLGTARPELPRRNRQAHLDDRLRTPAGGTPRRSPVAETEADPELARNRMAAFQRGTRQARNDTPDEPE